MTTREGASQKTASSSNLAGPHLGVQFFIATASPEGPESGWAVAA
jgi:hypothetical protein